jgi:hypothetical protein
MEFDYLIPTIKAVMIYIPDSDGGISTVKMMLNVAASFISVFGTMAIVLVSLHAGVNSQKIFAIAGYVAYQFRALVLRTLFTHEGSKLRGIMRKFDGKFACFICFIY